MCLDISGRPTGTCACSMPLPLEREYQTSVTYIVPILVKHINEIWYHWEYPKESDEKEEGTI